MHCINWILNFQLNPVSICLVFPGDFLEEMLGCDEMRRMEYFLDWGLVLCGWQDLQKIGEDFKVWIKSGNSSLSSLALLSSFPTIVPAEEKLAGFVPAVLNNELLAVSPCDFFAEKFSNLSLKKVETDRKAVE